MSESRLGLVLDIRRALKGGRPALEARQRKRLAEMTRFIRPDPCPCGSPLPAFRVVGRSSQVMTLRRPDREAVFIAPMVVTGALEKVRSAASTTSRSNALRNRRSRRRAESTHR